MTGTDNGRAPVELDPSVYRAHEAELDQAAAAEFDDFDAFWRGANQVKPARIRGLFITPPTDLPLALIGRLDGVMGSSDESAIKGVVRDIFGVDVVDQWAAAGMGLREFQTVLAWAGASMRGTPVDFAEAHRIASEALDAMAAGQGKAPGNREERRKKRRAGQTKSGGTGR